MELQKTQSSECERDNGSETSTVLLTKEWYWLLTRDWTLFYAPYSVKLRSL